MNITEAVAAKARGVPEITWKRLLVPDSKSPYVLSSQERLVLEYILQALPGLLEKVPRWRVIQEGPLKGYEVIVERTEKTRPSWLVYGKKNDPQSRRGILLS